MEERIIDGEENDGEESDEDLQKSVPPEELQKLEEAGRIISAKYGSPYQPTIMSTLSQRSGGSEDIPQVLSSVSSASAHIIPPQAPRVGSENSADSLLGLTLHYSGTVSSGSEGEHVTGEEEESLEDVLALKPSLGTALRLNMTLQKNFRTRHQTLVRELAKNRDRQAKLREEIKQSRKLNGSVTPAGSRMSDMKPPLRISYFCFPYFKNSSGMNAPMNDDAKKKVDGGYLDLYTMKTRAWLASERQRLTDTVHAEWKLCLQEELKSKLKAALRKLKSLSEEPDEDVVERETLEREGKKYEEDLSRLEETAANTLVPPKGAKLDWLKIAAQVFDAVRSSEECFLQWENYLHPTINRSMWTEEEDLQLQEMVLSSKNKVPDWEMIAKKMETGRTAFLVMQRWVSFIAPTLKPAKWTTEATQKLFDTVNMLRNGSFIPWAQVHQHMVGFSRAQLQTRWRTINPDVSKGSFTIEEDFIMIKGLHMFGLNFTSISHFIPGRTAVQVKDRYRRTILPSFTHHPWTREEDDRLIDNCKVGTKDWKKMMVDHLPRHTPCQIRGRYFVIQVWQTLSGTNMVPPPLFPITMTVDKDVIAEIRTHLIMDSCKVKQLVDSSRMGLNVKSAIQELEDRRLVIKARKETQKQERLKKLMEIRGRKPGVSIIPRRSLADITLEEFFMPYRKTHSNFTHARKAIYPSMAILTRAVRPAVRAGVQPLEYFSASALHLSLGDIQLVTQLVKENKELKAGKCSKDRVYEMPLLPPNQTTVGTYCSLLHHQHKLAEMASGEFVLHRSSWSELAKLKSSKHRKKTLKEEMIKKRKKCGKAPILYPGSTSWQDSRCESQKEAQPGPSGVTALSTDASQHSTSTSLKIHITSKGKGKRPAMKSAMGPCMATYSRVPALSDSSVTLDTPCAATKLDVCPDSVTTFTRDDMGCASISPSDTHPATTSATPEECVQSQRKTNGRKTEDELAREQADDLLFQRMTSLFFWPILMSLSQPSSNYVKMVEKAESKKQAENQKQKRENKGAKRPKVSMLTKDQLDVEEMETYIQELAEKDSHHRNWLKLRSQRKKQKQHDQEEEEDEGMMANKRKKTEEEDLEESQMVRKYPRGRGRGKGKLTSQSASVPATDSSGAHPSLPTSAPSVSTASDSDSSISSSCNEQLKELGELPGGSNGVGQYRRKQNLKSLRRSLVMKKVWAGRRAGALPGCTKTRQRRSYKPQASRSRNMVVPLPTTSSKETPAPWDLPLDGPLRVQPQVPLDKDFIEKQVKGVINQSSHQKQKKKEGQSTRVETDEPRQAEQDDKRPVEEVAQVCKSEDAGREKNSK